mmetsp:Transcript_1356/g.3645  ORF Transcript_1356/g.3645 Transcript_1356/m.3645 type:complete len:219 (-) Transcript_1356:802-1458(-)
MLGHAHHLTVKGFNNEMNLVCWQSFDAFLDHMVPMLIFHAFKHSAFQLADEKDLLLCLHRLNGLLHNSAAIGLRGKLQDLTHQVFSENLALNAVAELKELLDDIVAKDVHHQERHLAYDCIKGALLLVCTGSAKLLLYQPRAPLVLSNLTNVGKQFAQLHRSIPLLQLLDDGTAGGSPTIPPAAAIGDFRLYMPGVLCWCNRSLIRSVPLALHRTSWV